MMEKLTQGLSVVIPAHNEEKIIEATISEILAYLRGHFSDFELIVVDDGSDDKTLELIAPFEGVVVISNAQKKGKGYSVKTGILSATKEYVLFIDADHTMSINYLADFFHEVDKYDVVIGSKYLKKNPNYPLFRTFLGRLFSFVKRIITGLAYKDSQCGFKLFKTTMAHKIIKLSFIDGWCFDVELLYIAKQLKVSVKEKFILVKKKVRPSRINILSGGFKMLRDLLVIRWNGILGRYRFIVLICLVVV